MKNIDFTIPEFTKLMREYSDSNTAIPVDASCWRAMKRTLVQNKRLVRVNVRDNYIRFYEGGDFPGDSWHTTHTPGLSTFIEWLLAKRDMVNSSASTNSCYTTNVSTTESCNIDVSMFDGYPIYGINTNTPSTKSYTLPPSCLMENQFVTIKNENKKEKKNMFNFDFGKITSDKVRFSMYGIAVKNVDGRYVAYDVKTHSVMDVEILNMPCSDMLYKMPVAIKDITAGDVVIHNKVPMFVIEVHDSTIKVVDIHEGTEKEIYLTKNMFNFNYAVKVVSMMDMFNKEMKPSADNPFGNIGMWMMLFNDNKDMSDILPMMLMSGNMKDSNPMMMYMLMKDKDNIDPMMMMFLMNSQGTSK